MKVAVWIAALVTVAALSWWTASDYVERERRFMADCTKERKEYECTAMWRSGDPQTVVVQVPR